MKAIIVSKPGGWGNLTFDNLPDPMLKEDEVLIRVKGIGVNRADILQREGKYPPVPGASPLLGLEVSGEIEELGTKVRGWKKGDRVCTLLPGGGYAELAVAPASLLIPIPEQISYEEAAGIPEVFLTAYQCLFWKAGLKENETVCIHAGASGVGTAAIQLAKDRGAEVIVTVGTNEKKRRCIELGADFAINYKQEDFSKEILSITDGKGVNVILDFVGASYWKQNITSLAIDGRMVMISFLGGARLKDISLGPIINKRLQIIGTTLKSRDIDYKSRLVKEFIDQFGKKLAQKKIFPVIHRIYDWQDVQQAHQEMEGNRNIGKIILRVKD